MSGPAVIAVSGVKNSGKTTFLEHVTPLLRAMGLRVGIIKHDGHDFEPDVPGTDSRRMREAGAQAVAVYSANRWMLVREEPDVALSNLLDQMRGMDVVLLEGQKHSDWPKIELVRAAVSNESVCRPDTLLALATDTGVRIPGVPALPLDGYEDAARLIFSCVKRL